MYNNIENKFEVVLMTKRELLKINMNPLFNKVKKLNLYVVELNKYSNMDFDRVYNELMEIKKQVGIIEKGLEMEPNQQKLSL